MGLSIIAACLPTLAPLFRNLSAEKLGRRMRSFFSLRFRSARVVKSVSETNILRHIGAENNVRLETIAMGTFESGTGDREMVTEQLNGQIMVTKGLSRHSSVDAV